MRISNQFMMHTAHKIKTKKITFTVNSFDLLILNVAWKNSFDCNFWSTIHAIISLRLQISLKMTAWRAVFRLLFKREGRIRIFLVIKITRAKRVTFFRTSPEFLGTVSCGCRAVYRPPVYKNTYYTECTILCDSVGAPIDTDNWELSFETHIAVKSNRELSYWWILRFRPCR